MLNSHRDASLVMMRPGVQFSLAAPALQQYLQQVAPFHRPLAPVDYVQERAERFGNAQIETGKIRAICSRPVPATLYTGECDG